MKKKICGALAFLMAGIFLSGCGSENPDSVMSGEDDDIIEETGSSEVENIQILNGVLTFSGIKDADSYEIEFQKDGEIYLSEVVDCGYLNLAPLSLAGNYTVYIYAVKDDKRSEGVSTQVTFLSTIDSVVFEAELGLQNYNGYRINELAHGGAYVGGIDNAGQGVSFYVFSYCAGEFSFDCYYTTDVVNSENTIYVNGKEAGKFLYTEKTGWGSAESYNPAKATSKIVLEKGWNKIAVIKNGSSENNWGGWAELDYFVLNGNGEKYNIDDFGEYNLEIAPSYQLEAEHAAHISRSVNGANLKWDVTANPPAFTEGASGDFIVQGINDIGQGLEWAFQCPKAGYYRIKVSYAHDNGETTGATSFDASLYFSEERLIGREMTKEVLDTAYGHQTLSLGEGKGWAVPVLSQSYLEVWFDEGENFIYLTKETQTWFQLDYIELSYMGDSK